jgi:hypothetical protein
VKYFILKIIRLYQKYISPLLGPSCRFHPTCSNYAFQAVEKYGALRGSFFAIKRILKCNPWGGSGADPLPEEK